MFKSEMKEERETEIPIEEVSYDVFLSMLEFTYTDRVEVSGDMTIDLLKAANRFGLEGLRTKCEEQFSQVRTKVKEPSEEISLTLLVDRIFPLLFLQRTSDRSF